MFYICIQLITMQNLFNVTFCALYLRILRIIVNENFLLIKIQLQ